MSLETHEALSEIASVIQCWLDFNEKSRIREGLVVDGDTSVTAIPAPTYPNRNMLALWVAAIKDGAEKAWRYDELCK